MATTVQKWGNSLGVRIPKAVAEQARLTEGAQVEFDTTGGVLTIRPTRARRRKYKLADLLAKMKPRHRHGELHIDNPRGGELL
ncbi:MAG TPA: AbrB/MazE/SpoVT family DNA-binding domain-containing protein [Tepidisphaeraceae bacterium]